MTPEEEKKIIADAEELLKSCKELDEELKYIAWGSRGNYDHMKNKESDNL